MFKFITRLLGAVVAAACLASAAQALPAPESRSLTLDDITALEAFGRAAVSPDGRWAIYEKRGRYDTIERYDFEWRSTWSIMDLWLVDLQDPSKSPERLLPGEQVGLQRIAWSPDGRRLLISRVQAGRLELGMVSMRDRSVRWTGLTLDVPRAGATAEWVSPDVALVLTRPAHDLPASMRYQAGSQVRIAEAWERTAEGREASRTVLDASAGVVTTETPSPERHLVLLDFRNGETRPLAEGLINDFAASPDGSKVAVLEAGAGLAMSPDSVAQFESKDRQRLTIVSLSSGEARQPLPERDVAPGLLRWSPDSKAVLVWARHEGEAWTAGDLVGVGPNSVVTYNLAGLSRGTSRDIPLGVRADWLGDAAVLYAKGVGRDRADWTLLSATAAPKVLTSNLQTVAGQIAASDGSAFQLFSDGASWSLSLEGLRRIGPADGSIQPLRIGDQEQVLRLKGNEPPRRDWSMASSAAGETLVLKSDGAWSRLGRAATPLGRTLAASPDAILFLRREGLSETLVVRTTFGDRAVDAVNRTRADVSLIEPRAITHKDVQGRETRSWLFLPDAGAPIRGVIVRVYPGSTDNFVWLDPLSMTYAFGSQLPAASGFAVLSPSIPVDGPLASRGEDIVRSVDLAVDAALAAFPQLPADRMAVMGHSFGGYAALEIAVRSHRYRAYIASSGFSDMFGMWGELDPATRVLPEDGGMIRATQGWTEEGQGGLGAPPWAAAEAYAAASPYLSADQINAPVLLLTADFDFIPISQSERMFTAILRNGGRARLITYWGEHHNFWSPANIRDRYEQVFAWLDLTLGDGRVRPVPVDAPTTGPSLPGPPPP